MTPSKLEEMTIEQLIADLRAESYRCGLAAKNDSLMTHNQRGGRVDELSQELLRRVGLLRSIEEKYEFLIK